MMGRFLLLATLCAASLTTTAAKAGCTAEEYAFTLGRALVMAAAAGSDGYTLVQDVEKCASTSYPEDYSLGIEANYDYMVVAVGSQFTIDVDAWLFWTDGSLVDQDTSEHPHPTLRIRSAWPALLTYRVRAFTSPKQPVWDAHVRILVFRRRR
jgi:hypothetical protein